MSGTLWGDMIHEAERYEGIARKLREAAATIRCDGTFGSTMCRCTADKFKVHEHRHNAGDLP